ncbi:MAG: SdpI family protein [Candidatus Bathyarchaeia archaeon]|nr:SdpI family protein [Candidatus Bathyarchaeota archaeon]
MEIRKVEIILLGLTLLPFITGVYFYPHMPERMASHWNIGGEVDGYLPKFWGLFLIPFILLGLVLIFISIPRIDPLKANIEKFRKYYDVFIIIFFIFMFSIYSQVILWNLDLKISPNATIPIGLGLLFFYIGILCENSKQNWFIGIRTPWTLSSERVWEKTHKLGGKLFKIAGISALFGAFFQSYALFFILAPAILVSICSMIYSYLEYQKEMKTRDVSGSSLS